MALRFLFWTLAYFAFICAAKKAELFGPHNCVSVMRSKKGTCSLDTNCKGVETSQLEFAFICEDKEKVRTMHSYGKGGFDEIERFDTGVVCAKCMAPTNLSLRSSRKKKSGRSHRLLKQQVLGHVMTSREDPVEDTAGLKEPETNTEAVTTSAETEAAPAVMEVDPDNCTDARTSYLGTIVDKHEEEVSQNAPLTQFVSYFGPHKNDKGCLKTYQENNTCRISSDCEGVEDFAAYTVVLNCLAGKGEINWHAILPLNEEQSPKKAGPQSAFLPEETGFDTKIEGCIACIGVDSVATECLQYLLPVTAMENELDPALQSVHIALKDLDQRVTALESAANIGSESDDAASGDENKSATDNAAGDTAAANTTNESDDAASSDENKNATDNAGASDSGDNSGVDDA